MTILNVKEISHNLKKVREAQKAKMVWSEGSDFSRNTDE